MKKKTIAKFLLPIATTFALLTTNACSNPEQEKQQAYQRALKYINENNTKAAIIELKNAIQIDPKFSDAHHKLGKLYLDSDAPAKAYEEYVSPRQH